MGALWERHTLWQIRYPALFPDAIKGQATTHIATAVCLEEPADILNQLKAFDSATITIVRRDGEIQEREIAGFLDAERMAITEHNFEAAMNYHRTHHGPTGVVVNVPAHILQEPVPAPDWVSWPQFLQTHAPTLAAAWLGIWPDELVEMTAAEIVERMGLTEE